jgi:hypothetical protein
MHTKYPHIERMEMIEEAEFQEIGDWTDRLIRGVDSLVGHRRGFIVTEAIVARDLSDTPQELRRYYQQHQAVVDGYFQFVDPVKVGKLFSEDGELHPKTLLQKAAPVAIGIAIGGLISGIILRRF